MRKHISPLLLEKPNVVVADEGHEIKNPSTSRAKALMKIKTKKRIALTGYPLQNRLMEYYTMVNWTNKGLLDSEEEFKASYVAPITAGKLGSLVYMSLETNVAAGVASQLYF